MTQVWNIAITTVNEAIRRKVLLIIFLVGVIFLVVAPSLGVLSARSETTILKSMMLGIIQLTSAVIAIVLTVYLLPNEIERKTIYTILSKPVQRWQFLMGKYLGSVFALGMMMLLMTIVLVLVFFLQRQAVDLAAGAELAKAPLMFFVQMSLLGAVAIFFSTFVTPLVNFFISGGVFMAGSLFAPFFDTIANNPATHPVSKKFAEFVVVAIPNFNYFNVQNPIINPEVQISNETQHFINITIYGVVYIAIMLIGGAMIFDKREI